MSVEIVIKHKITRELVNEAREFSRVVHLRKKDVKDKFITGNEESADFTGFLFEFACCDFFSLPKPVLFEGTKVDEFDILLNDLKIDVKESKKCLINKLQFEKKKGKVDAFLFGTNFLGDWSAGVLFVEFFGWISYDDVVSCSELIKFDNGSEAYKVSKRKLKSIEKLKESFL